MTITTHPRKNRTCLVPASTTLFMLLVSLAHPVPADQHNGAATGLDPLTILGVEPAPGEAPENQFLQPDEAFRFSTEVVDEKTVVARWRIADTYYLYQNKFRFKVVDPPEIRLQGVTLPQGIIKNDPYFGTVEVFYRNIEARIDLARDIREGTDLQLELGYQGCTELGLCYPPITRKISLNLPAGTD